MRNKKNAISCITTFSDFKTSWSSDHRETRKVHLLLVR